MKIEFKEKPFEKQFAIEIGRLTNVSYSLDQCDEKFLGFDDAFYLSLQHPLSLSPELASAALFQVERNVRRRI